MLFAIAVGQCSPGNNIILNIVIIVCSNQDNDENKIQLYHQFRYQIQDLSAKTCILLWTRVLEVQSRSWRANLQRWIPFTAICSPIYCLYVCVQCWEKSWFLRIKNQIFVVDIFCVYCGWWRLFYRSSFQKKH